MQVLETAPATSTAFSMLNADELTDAKLFKEGRVSALAAPKLLGDLAASKSTDAQQSLGSARSVLSLPSIANSSASNDAPSVSNKAARLKQKRALKAAVSKALEEFSTRSYLYEQSDNEVKMGVIPPNEFEQVMWGKELMVRIG